MFSFKVTDFLKKGGKFKLPIGLLVNLRPFGKKKSWNLNAAQRYVARDKPALCGKLGSRKQH